MKNNGERPMYLVTDHHDPIIDRDTFNRVQQELARRSGKRKISDKTKTEQGKYSGKYSLSELMICGHCGTPYRRKIWMKNGVKLAVWRCISRLEHGKKYCPDSPTIKEEQLHKVIIRAINNYYSCRDDIAKILKANIGTVLECQGQEEIISIKNRLKEIDQARNDLVMLIASGGCDEDKLDSEFANLYQEERQLSERLDALKSQNSRVVGTSEIKDFELEFRGVATIVLNKGATVPVLIWELDERDLPTLNRYEGWPRLYRQEKMPFELNGKCYEGMAYLMNRGEITPPSQQYYNTILQGYRENGLDESFLQKALENSLRMDLAEEELDEDFDMEYFENIDYDDDFQMKL